MNSEQFASAYRQDVFNPRLESYINILKTAMRQTKRSTPWQGMFQVWGTLNDQQREDVLQFIRLVMVESASELFSLIDNETCLAGRRAEFELRFGPPKSNEKVSGAITDYFLSDEEEHPPGKLWDPKS